LVGQSEQRELLALAGPDGDGVSRLHGEDDGVAAHGVRVVAADAGDRLIVLLQLQPHHGVNVGAVGVEVEHVRAWQRRCENARLFVVPMFLVYEHFVVYYGGEVLNVQRVS